jgi:hypothetical protein
VQFEGAPHKRVAATLVNRFIFLRCVNERAPYKSLAAFTQAYARPINPAWSFDGIHYVAAYEAAKTEQERARLKRIAHRIAKQRRANDFSLQTLEAVETALTQTQDVGAVTDYGAPFRETPEHLELVGQHEAGTNSFYAVRGSRWRGYQVTIAPTVPFVGLDERSPLRCKWRLELSERAS